MSRASSIHRLQTIDLKLLNHHARLEEIQAILADSAEVSARRQELEKAEARLHEASIDTKRAEHTVGSQRSKIQDTDKKLYGGAIRNPKELQDLQQESESLKRYLSTLEDRLLDAMLVQEEAEEAHRSASEALELAEADQAEEHASLTDERADRLRLIEKLEGEREVAVESVPPEDLAFYTSLQRELGNQVISLVDQDCCSSCGMILSASARQQARSPHEFVRCSQCGRILYAE